MVDGMALRIFKNNLFVILNHYGLKVHRFD